AVPDLAAAGRDVVHRWRLPHLAAATPAEPRLVVLPPDGARRAGIRPGRRAGRGHGAAAPVAVMVGAPAAQLDHRALRLLRALGGQGLSVPAADCRARGGARRDDDRQRPAARPLAAANP